MGDKVAALYLSLKKKKKAVAALHAINYRSKNFMQGMINLTSASRFQNDIKYYRIRNLNTKVAQRLPKNGTKVAN